MVRAYQYVSCGLTIASEIPIPGLTAVAPTTQPGLVVSVRNRASPPMTELGAERIRYVSPERDA